MKKLIFLLTMLCSFSGIAQDSQLFEAANNAYAEGDYMVAVTKYEQILKNGKTSSELHYNLGNAFYKLNRIAPSIYHYEKALQLDPGNEDARNNLTFARTMAIDALGEEDPGYRGIFDNSTSAFTASGWARAAIFCVLLFVVSFLVYYFSRRTIVKRLMFIGSMFFLILAISSAVIGYLKLDFQQESNYAIVFSEEVQVKSEPSVRSGEVFMLHEGAKVRITQNFQEWVEIELPNGSQGWMQENDLKRL